MKRLLRVESPSARRPRGLLGMVCFAVLATGCGERDLLCRGAGGPALSTLRVRIDGKRLYDAAGRELLLRGVNAGGRTKIAPFFPFAFAESGALDQASAPSFESAAAAYVAKVRAWGHTVVRFPFTWEAMEPTRGHYDDGYLARYARVAELFGEGGIRVIVDFHQDVFAAPYCGDGFPLWTCPEPIPPRPSDCRNWFSGYAGTTTPVAAAFDRFWSDADGIQTAFRALWKRVAARLWQVDAVIGFEILNEPGAGSSPEETWAPNVLTPFFERSAAAIREAAPGAPIFFDATGRAGITVTTTQRVPSGGDMIFAPHYYSGTAFLGGISPPDRASIIEALGGWAAKRDGFGVPLFVGEFGYPAETPGASEGIRYNFDGLDRHLLHGTLWEYSATADDWNHEGMSIAGAGGVEKPVAAEVVRVYPRAIAGALESTAYDAVTRTATVVIDARPGLATEIVAPARLYPNGPEVRLRGVSACAATADGIVRVTTAAAGPLTIELAPR